MLTITTLALLVLGLIYIGWWGWALYQHVKKRLDSTEIGALLLAASAYAGAGAWALDV